MIFLTSIDNFFSGVLVDCAFRFFDTLFISCNIIRTTDIGKSKAQVAADFINKRVPGCCVTPYPYDYFFPGMILCHNNSMNEEIFFVLILARYCCKIQDHGPDFYQRKCYAL